MIEIMTETIELWKKVSELPTMSEFREEYLVSNFGRLKLLSGKISEVKPRKDGYIQSILYTKSGKRKNIYLHRLVALAFCEGYQEDLVVNHRDENPFNNHFSNLEWITQTDNINHGTRNERTEKPVEAITDGVIFGFKSTQHAAEFGFNQGGVSAACSGVYNPQGKLRGTRIYKGYEWRYA